ncbi:MAG TPA: hypothetical protein VHV08_10095 [Pirellulales bacterium]|nr:hypothetical protein [Pirellulales bacterium]
MASQASEIVADSLARETIATNSVALRSGLVPRFAALVSAMLEWVFGALSLIVGLAVLATIPIVQLVSLGYLLEASGRVARSGRVRAGFVGVRKAAVIGRIVIGVSLLMAPLWLASSLRSAARLIDPESRAARGWSAALVVLSVIVLSQIASAMLRGGRIRHFLWPRPLTTFRLLKEPGAYCRARDSVCDFLLDLHLPHYFSLGLRGFVGAAAWLAVPISLLAAASRLTPGAGFAAAIIGGAWLALVLLHLPFLQARFAAENRLGAMFELRAQRRQFAEAPVAFFIALAVTLALALPLYLLKIEILPREAAWLPSLLFVVSIFPARLSSGWALARANRADKPRGRLWCWPCRLAMVGVVLAYVFLAYFTQYLSWYGVWSLYEQHAFLVPAPFLEF